MPRSPAAHPEGAPAVAAPALAASRPLPTPWLWAPAALVLCLGLLLARRYGGRGSAPKRRHARAARGGRGQPKASRRQPQRAALWQQRGPSRDIQLRVVCQGTGQEAGVSIDALATGEALLLRARGCVGEGLAELRLPCGGALSGARPLAAQGLRSGDLVYGVIEGGGAAACAGGAARPERQRLTLERFSFDSYASEVSPEHHRLDVTISARQEPAALAVATSESVACEFTENGFTLTVRGPGADYVLRRNMESRGGVTRDNVLAANFDLCPPRCTVKVTPRQCIRISLRPTPDDWLKGGTRVRIQGLKESAELNGLAGAVEGYEEYAGKYQPARYVVRVDGSSELKKIKRKNLVTVGAPRADGSGEAGKLGAPGSTAGTQKPQRESPAEDRVRQAGKGGEPRPKALAGQAAPDAATPLQLAAALGGSAATVLRDSAAARHGADAAAGAATRAAHTEGAPVAQMLNCQRLSSVEKGASALRKNIADKGSNAYYFAHDRAYEVPSHAKVITGPGLVAGGPPQKLSGPDGAPGATWSCEELE